MLPDKSPAPDLVTLAGDVVAAYVTKNSVRTGDLPRSSSARRIRGSRNASGERAGEADAARPDPEIHHPGSPDKP